MSQAKKLPTAAQGHQRELAWALFITEGAAANMRHAIAVNAYTLPRTDLALLNRVLRGNEVSANELRARLKELES